VRSKWPWSASSGPSTCGSSFPCRRSGGWHSSQRPRFPMDGGRARRTPAESAGVVKTFPCRRLGFGIAESASDAPRQCGRRGRGDASGELAAAGGRFAVPILPHNVEPCDPEGMADRARALPENVEGSIFVDATCIDCDSCRQLAPTVFGETCEFSFVKRQPRNPVEQTRRIARSGGVSHRVDRDCR
jgi:hypothetical protein